MRRLQSRELEAAAISTLARLGELSSALPFTPRRGSVETYIRLREQARVQLEGRIKGEPIHELLLPIETDLGLARLPAPSAGDVFLDLEAQDLLETADANTSSALSFPKTMEPSRTKATGRTPMLTSAPRSRLWWMRFSGSGKPILGCTSTTTPLMSLQHSSV